MSSAPSSYEQTAGEGKGSARSVVAGASRPPPHHPGHPHPYQPRPHSNDGLLFVAPAGFSYPSAPQPISERPTSGVGPAGGRQERGRRGGRAAGQGRHRGHGRERGGRRGGGGGQFTGEASGGGAVGFRWSFVEDPWAALEGRPLQSILPQLDHVNEKMTGEEGSAGAAAPQGQGDERAGGQAGEIEKADGQEGAAAMDVPEVVDAGHSAGIGDGLILPPPRYS